MPASSGYTNLAGHRITVTRFDRRSRPKGEGMGINRWSDMEERKRRETDAKAGERLPKEKKGDASSRLEASEGPAEDQEKRRIVEKLGERDS
jgi:hypothetical protein